MTKIHFGWDEYKKKEGACQTIKAESCRGFFNPLGGPPDKKGDGETET
jgi:hypothetical protein